MKKWILLNLLLPLILAEPKTPPKYNGQLEYFIADVAPGYPCHKNFNYDDTWFFSDDKTNDWQGIRKVLNGLSAHGFNAIRLPMWPDDERVEGPNPGDPKNPWRKPYTRTQCDQISKNIVHVLKNSHILEDPLVNGTYLDDAFFYFKIYYSPAYDGRQYQASTSDYDYAAWVLNYMASKDY